LHPELLQDLRIHLPICDLTFGSLERLNGSACRRAKHAIVLSDLMTECTQRRLQRENFVALQSREIRGGSFRQSRCASDGIGE
jgi:hypothetical protein